MGLGCSTDKKNRGKKSRAIASLKNSTLRTRLHVTLSDRLFYITNCIPSQIQSKKTT
jgi:hypothetical protein